MGFPAAGERLKSLLWAAHGAVSAYDDAFTQSQQTLADPSSGTETQMWLRRGPSPQRAHHLVADIDYGIRNGVSKAILGSPSLDAAEVVERALNSEAGGPGPNAASSTSLEQLQQCGKSYGRGRTGHCRIPDKRVPYSQRGSGKTLYRG